MRVYRDAGPPPVHGGGPPHPPPTGSVGKRESSALDLSHKGELFTDRCHRGQGKPSGMVHRDDPLIVADVISAARFMVRSPKWA